MGVDLARYAWQDRTLPAAGPVRLLSVARLVEKKGIEYALDAVAALPADLRSRVDYRVAGDGPLRAALAARIERLGIGAQVTLLGWQDQEAIARLVAGSHLLLLPSVTASDGDQEGIPVSAMEAMATGLPVVATRHSGIPELVRAGENGWLVAERDAAGLAAAIAGALTDATTYRRYAERSRQAIADGFDEAGLNATLARLLRPR
jgi:colanic acid/amylovoran biosynthesis glycosyltransferase